MSLLLKHGDMTLSFIKIYSTIVSSIVADRPLSDFFTLLPSDKDEIIS